MERILGQAYIDPIDAGLPWNYLGRIPPENFKSKGHTTMTYIEMLAGRGMAIGDQVVCSYRIPSARADAAALGMRDLA